MASLESLLAWDSGSPEVPDSNVIHKVKALGPLAKGKSMWLAAPELQTLKGGMGEKSGRQAGRKVGRVVMEVCQNHSVEWFKFDKSVNLIETKKV